MALALASSLSWVDVGEKKALVCEISSPAQSIACLEALPLDASRQLNLSSSELSLQLGRRSAVAMPIEHDKVAGIVLFNDLNTPKVQTAAWNGIVYQLDLQQQPKLTFWHELGHLYLSEFEFSYPEFKFDAFRHEVFADAYLVWRVAREYSNLDLAWQQYHRRNLAMVDNQRNMSHWSAPILLQVLTKYNKQTLAEFSSFDAFLMDFLAKNDLPTDDELGEYASLMRRTFGPGVVQPLPGYMFWRKEGLKQILSPTFALVMGERKANIWFDKVLMLSVSNKKSLIR